MTEEKKPEPLTRRGFIKTAVVAVAVTGGVVGAATSYLLPQSPLEPQGPAEPQAPAEPQRVVPPVNVPLSRGVIMADVEKCTGCRICELTCSLYKEGKASGDLSRIIVYGDDIYGMDYSVNTCAQCVVPECLRYCPVGAIVVDARTIARVIDSAKCKGCQVCITACQQVGFNPSRIQFDREKNKALKCDLCGGDPQCVKMCHNNALMYYKDEMGIMSGWMGGVKP